MTDTLWIVTCTDLHLAVGPFGNEVDAVQQAVFLTRTSECTFKPVPFTAVVKNPHEVERDWRGKMTYL